MNADASGHSRRGDAKRDEGPSPHSRAGLGYTAACGIRLVPPSLPRLTIFWRVTSPPAYFLFTRFSLLAFPARRELRRSTGDG